MIHVATFTPHPRPADHVIHLGAHRSAWGEFVHSGANEATAGDDADALAAALSLVSAKTREGLTDKLSAIRDRLVGGSVLDLIEAGCVVDLRLVASCLEDALGLAGEKPE
jgi:hypothetical protein